MRCRKTSPRMPILATASCLLLALGLRVAAPAEIQNPDEARATALLKKTVAKMSSIKSFQADVALNDREGDRITTLTGSLEFIAPDKARYVFAVNGGELTQIASGGDYLLASRKERLFVKEEGLGEEALQRVIRDASNPRTDHLRRLLLGQPLVRAFSTAVWRGEEGVGADKIGRVALRTPPGVVGLAEDSSLVLRLRESDGAYMGCEFEMGPGLRSTTEYSNVQFDPKLDPARFIASPPEGFVESPDPQEKEPILEFKNKHFADFPMTPLAGGAPILFSSLKGQPILLDLWATWCPPCREAMPYLDQIAVQGKKAGLRVVCVATDEPAEVAKFVRKRKLANIEVYLDPEEKARRVYKAPGFPASFAIDAGGIIRAIDPGYGGPSSLKKLVASLGIKISLKDKDILGDQAYQDGLSRFLLGDRAGALETFARTAAEHPDNWDLVNTYILALCEAGRVADAAKEAVALGEKLTDDAESLNNLAYVMADKDLNLPKAEEFARRSIALEDGFFVRDTLGWILVKRGKFTDAIPLLKKAVEDDMSGVVSYHLGVAFEGAGDKAAARAAYEKAVALGFAPPAAAKKLKALGGAA